MDFRHQEVAEGVYAGDAHAVQAARHLVAVFVELAAGVQHGKHHLEGAPVLFLMHAGGDAAAVVLHADGVVREYLYVHVRAEAGHGLVYTVVHHFVHQVMQASFAYIADIHGGTLPNCLKAFQNLDTAGRILLFRLTGLLVFYHVFSYFL